jgi:hypothetical protein
MPLYISSRGYGLQLDTYYRTEFDLGREDAGVAWAGVETNELNATFFFGASPLESFLMSTAKNGYSLIPPRWQFAPWNMISSERSRARLRRLRLLPPHRPPPRDAQAKCPAWGSWSARSRCFGSRTCRCRTMWTACTFARRAIRRGARPSSRSCTRNSRRWA